MTIWSEFIENPIATRVYLVHITVAKRVGSSITTKTLYLSNYPKEFDNYYVPCVEGIPRFNRSLQDLFSGWSMPSWGELSIYRADSTYLTASKDISFDDLVDGTWECSGRDIEILFGGDNMALEDYQVIMTGKVDKIESWNNTNINISILDKQEILRKKEVNKNVINLTDYPNATTSIVDKAKPFAIGYCINVKPVLVDSTARKYLVHDTSIADYLGVSAVYAKGKSVAFTNQTVDGTFTLDAAHDGTITCNCYGFKYEGNYCNYIGDIFKGLLITCSGVTASGIIEEDITNINNIYPYSFGHYVTSAADLLNVLDSVSEGLPIWYGFNRIGEFEIKDFTTVTETPTQEFNTDSIMPGFTGSTFGEIIHKVTIKYSHNVTKISADNVDSSVSDEIKTWLEEEWREHVTEDASILNFYPLADETEYETCLITQTAAASVANNWLDLLETKRQQIQFSLKSPGLACHLGETIKITYPRFTLTTGTLFRITDIEEDYSNNQYFIKAWR